MSTPRSGLIQFPVTVPIPEDSDQRAAASVAVPLEGLTDRTAWLKRLTDSATASNWTRYALVPPDISMAIAVNDGVARESYMYWQPGAPNSYVIDADGQLTTPTMNGIDVVARASHPSGPRVIAVEDPAAPGLDVELTVNGGTNWFLATPLPTNQVCERAAWANVISVSLPPSGGRFVVAGYDSTNGHPWVHFYNTATGALTSADLYTATAINSVSSLAIGGTDSSHILIADDNANYWLSTSGPSPAAVTWTEYSGAPWGAGVQIAWTEERGWLAAWQGANNGEFYWSQSDDAITWTAAVMVLLPSTSHVDGDLLVGSAAGGSTNPTRWLAAVGSLWILATADEATPKAGLKVVYSTDGGTSWSYHGFRQSTGFPALAASSNGLVLVAESVAWISHRAGPPRFGV